MQIKKPLGKILLILPLLLSLGVGAGAAPLYITNADFEIPALAVGTENNADVPGWTEFEPSGHPWEEDILSPTPVQGGAQSGSNVLKFIAYNGATAYVEQTLTNSLQNGMRYTLSGWTCALTAAGNGAKFMLYAGTNLLGSANVATSALNTWTNGTLVFDAGISSPYAGQALTVRIMQNGNNYQVLMDNITLDESPMPGTAATNFDFEIPAGLGVGAQNGPDYSVPGWKDYEPSQAFEVDIYRPTPGEGGAQSGSNVLKFLAYNATKAYAEQVLTNKLQSGMRYTLSGWALDPNGHTPENGARFMLYAGTNLLGVVSAVPGAAQTWSQATLVFDAGPSSPFVGQNLGIRIMQNTGNGFQVFVDNISLSTTTTPGVAPTNWDFEVPSGLGVGTEDGGAGYSVPGWTENEPTYIFEADIYNPTPVQGGAHSGNNVLKFLAVNTATAYVEQTLTNVLQNGKHYTLSIWACDPDGHSPENGARLFFYAGSTLLGVVTNAPSATATWNQASLDYDSGSSNPLAGQHLAVRIMQAPWNSYQAFMDDVSMTITDTAPTVAPNFTGFSYDASVGSIFTVTGAVSQTYSLLSSTNLSLPLTNWTTVTSGTISVSPFMLTNPPGNLPNNFYIFKSP